MCFDQCVRKRSSGTNHWSKQWSNSASGSWGVGSKGQVALRMASFPLQGRNRQRTTTNGGGPLAAGSSGSELNAEEGRALAPSATRTRPRRAAAALNPEGGDRAEVQNQSGVGPVPSSQAAGGSGQREAAVSLEQRSLRSASAGASSSAAPFAEASSSPGLFRKPLGQRVLSSGCSGIKWLSGRQVCSLSFLAGQHVLVRFDEFPTRPPLSCTVGSSVIPFDRHLLGALAGMPPIRCCHVQFFAARPVLGDFFLVVRSD